MSSKKISHLLNALRLFAILFVINSHCDQLYPNSYFATGGAIGNSIFFIISGYLLKVDKDFGRWMVNRIKRLYPLAIPMIVLRMIVYSDFPSSMISFVKMYVWPTNYWFIGALILFYIFIYIEERFKFKEWFHIHSIVIFAIIVVYYCVFMDKDHWSVESTGITTIQGCFKLVYYYYIFTLGYFFKDNKSLLSRRYILQISLGLFILSFAFKAALLKGIIPMRFQILSQFINIAFAYCSLAASIKFEHIWLKLPTKMIGVIDYLSACSFEAYLLQFIFIRLFMAIKFPTGILLVFVCTLLFAVIYHKCYEFVVSKANVANRGR